MGLVLGILALSFVAVIVSVLYFAYKLILLVDRERIVQHQLTGDSLPTPTFIPQEQPDYIHPLEEQGVPLDQFTPDFKKPIKVVIDDRDEYEEVET